jgi:hypothetical protein
MKNLHLEHPEDSILTGDLSVLDWFAADSTVSVKIDGSPAIVWGTNPANGKFFVGTKSVFNKIKIKINHTHEEIDQNHEGNVAQILHACLDKLPHVKTIYQGDFIGFGGFNEYTPNTITYRFPEVIKQNIIIAPHTCYYAESDLRDAVAMPDHSIWNDTETVKFVQPNASLNPHREDIEDICNFAKQMAMACNFVDEKETTFIKKQINACFRNQKQINEDEFSCDKNLIRLWKLVESIKNDMMMFIQVNDQIQCFIDEKETSHEGYVMSNEHGIYKLVNRYVFSYNNFNLIKKSWNLK